MRRIFVGLALPEDVRDRIAMIQTGLPGARWVKHESLHLTLAFIGETPEHLIEDAHSALSVIRAPCFDLRLSGVGQFGDAKPRAVWIGVEKCDALVTLQGRVETALRRAGLDISARKFMPHVTIGRLKTTPPDRVGRYIQRFGLFSAGPVPVREFHLFESHLLSDGGVYEALADYELV